MNNWVGTGRLTRDPELKTAGNNTTLCRFTMACDRRFKKDDQPNADFISCVAFNKTAEFIDKYFSKGKMIAVVGSIQTRNWTDDSGEKHYATEIVVDNVEFCGDANGGNNGNSNTAPATTSKRTASPPPPADVDDEEDPF